MSELTFEQAVVELEGIIKKLEDGRMPLEDAVKAFERGSELKKICEKKPEGNRRYSYKLKEEYKDI